MTLRLLPILLVAVILAGCAKPPLPASQPAIAGLGGLIERDDLSAAVRPPKGWIAQPVESGSNFTQQVWVAPAGGTAYGVIKFSLPLPVGHELVLRGFLKQLKEHEGVADLVEKTWDDDKECIRFVAKGGKYVVHTNLLVRGWRGWAVFAGTRTDQNWQESDLKLAEQAREETLINR